MKNSPESFQEPFDIFNSLKDFGNIQVKTPAMKKYEDYSLKGNGPILIFKPVDNKINSLFWVFLPMYNAQPGNTATHLEFHNLKEPAIVYDVVFPDNKKCSDAFIAYFDAITIFQGLLKQIDPHYCTLSDEAHCCIKEANKKNPEECRARLVLQKGMKFEFQAHVFDGNKFVKSWKYDFNDESYIGNVFLVPKSLGSHQIGQFMFMLKDKKDAKEIYGIFVCKDIQTAFKWTLSCFYAMEFPKIKPFIRSSPKPQLSSPVKPALVPTEKPQEKPKPVEKPKQVEQPKPEPQKVEETPKPVEKPKPQETPQPAEQPKPVEQPKSEIIEPKPQQEQPKQQPEPVVQKVEQPVAKEEKKQQIEVIQKVEAPKPQEKPVVEQPKPEVIKVEPVKTETPKPAEEKVTKQEPVKTEPIKPQEEPKIQAISQPKPAEEKPKIEEKPKVEEKPQIKVEVIQTPIVAKTEEEKPKIQEPKQEEKPQMKVEINQTPVVVKEEEIKKEEKPAQEQKKEERPSLRISVSKSSDTLNKDEQKKDDKPKVKPQMKITTSVQAKSDLVKQAPKKVEPQKSPVQNTEAKRFCTFPHPPPLKERLPAMRTHIAESCNTSRTESFYHPPSINDIIKNIHASTRENTNDALSSCLAQIDNTPRFNGLETYYAFTQNEVLREKLDVLQPTARASIRNFTPFREYPEFTRDTLEKPAPPTSAFFNTMLEFATMPHYVDSAVPGSNKLCFVVGSMLTNGLKETLQDLIKVLSEDFPPLRNVKFDKSMTKNNLTLGSILLNNDISIPCFEYIKKKRAILKFYLPSALITTDEFDDVLDFLDNLVSQRSFYLSKLEVDASVKEVKEILLVPHFVPYECDYLLSSQDMPKHEEVAELFIMMLELGAKDIWATLKTLSHTMKNRELNDVIAKIKNNLTLIREKDILNFLAVEGIKQRACDQWMGEIVLAVNTSKDHNILQSFYEISCIRDMNRAYNALCRLHTLMKKMGPPET